MPRFFNTISAARSALKSIAPTIASTAGTSMGKYVLKRRRGESLSSVKAKRYKRSAPSNKKTRSKKMNKGMKKLVKEVGKQFGIAPVIGKYYKTYAGQALIGSTGNVNWKCSDLLWRRAGTTSTSIRPLAFFRVADFVDAASVLFNNKTESTDGSLSTTNNFTDKELHYMVKYATFKVFFRNCTDQVIELNVIIAHPKDLEDDTFLDDWEDQYGNINVVGSVTPSPTIWNTEPGHIDGLKKRWAFTSKKVILQCGQSYTVSRSLKDFEFKNVEYYDNNAIKKYGKMSQFVSYRYNVLPTVHYAATGDKMLTGRAYVTADPAISQAACTGLLVEVNENYVVHAPEIATVTNKKDVICYHNDYDLTGTLTNKSKNFAKIYTESDNPVFGLTV